MVADKPYKDLDDTLVHLKYQVLDSIKYAANNVPHFDTPKELYNFLKRRVTYRNDPKDRELLMTMQTMMNGTRTGQPGAGDCDDFTITSLASLYVNGFDPLYLILVGRSSKYPVHVYAGVKWYGKIQPFDLTNDRFGYERKNYIYQQILPFKV